MIPGVAPAGVSKPFCGAWSLSGAPLDSRLPETRRQAAPSGAASVCREGRLWLCAAEGGWERRGSRWLAWDGRLCAGADGAWVLESRLRPPAPPPASGPGGHYVAVHADLETGTLTLLRDPTGGERLFFVVDGGVLYFATSPRAALALAGLEPALDGDCALERGLTEIVQFSDRTLFARAREVLPGHRLQAKDGGVRQENAWPGLLEPVEGDPPALAKALRARLKEDVALCVGSRRSAAVALSGGLDSSAVAALTAEVVGPDNVAAFTVEYDHPDHPSEVPYAAAVCRALGLRPPQVVKIGFEDLLACVPQGVWLTEDPRYWKRAYPMMLARAAAAAGFESFLTGFGVGSHMGYFEEFARVVPRLPLRERFLRLWARSRRPFPEASTLLSPLHPGLEAPMARLVYPIAAVLRDRGLLEDAGALFPGPLGELAATLISSPRVTESLRPLRGLELGRALQTAAYLGMNSCVDVARCEHVARRVGAAWLGPAHFPGSLPYCYLSPRPVPSLWDSRRRARPGKLLLSAAMRGTLPDAIIDRPKYWLHANGPAAWRDESLRRMDRAAGPSWPALRALFGPAFDEARRFRPEGMIPLAFWHRLCVARSSSAAPVWEELEC